MLTLNVVSFAFMVYHAITFFVPRRRRWSCTSARPVPGSLVLAGHYAAWAVASAAVFWLLLEGVMIKRHPEPLLWMLFSAGGVCRRC